MNLFKTSTLGFPPIRFQSPHVQQVASAPSRPLVPPRLLHPLRSPSLVVFLSVYLSTFTVTALESQESKLPPSLLSLALTADPRFSLALHLSPSQRLRVTSLCEWREWTVPPYSSSRQPALSCSSHAQCPPIPRHR